jgi:YbbR domain-containing protein
MSFNFDNEISKLSRLPQDVLGWLKVFFLKDWGLKLIALAVALVLWFGVTGQRTPATKSLSGVKLSFALPRNVDIGNDYRNEVNIVVSGDKSEVARIDDRSLVATVDISDYQTGERLVQLTPKNVSLDLPTGVKLESITPNSVLIRLEQHLEKEIDVEPQFAGKVADGYEIIGKPEVIPAKVRISGPENHVKALEKAVTSKISLDGLKADYTATQVAIDIKDEKVSVADLGVTVKIKIGELRIEKTFDGVPVSVNSGERARPETASVVLYGEKSIVEKLRKEEISIVLDVAQDGSITPRLVLPQSLQNRIELRSTKPSGFSIVKQTSNP